MIYFSIIIPVYNVEKYLTKCIESILVQTYKNYEIILVDDGSTDNSSKICDKYQLAYPKKIRVIHKKNGGLSDARNFGLNIADGKYVIFMDSDDFWNNENILHRFYFELEENRHIEMLLFLANKYFENTNRLIPDKSFDLKKINKKSKNEIIKYLIKSNTYSMAAYTKVISKKFLIENNILFEKGLLGEDLDWYMYLLLKVDKIHAINEHFYMYRIREGSITNSYKLKNLTDLIGIIDKWDSRFKLEMKNCRYLKYYLAILSKAYGTGILGYSLLDPFEKKEAYKILKNYNYILKYSKDIHTKIIALFVRIFGIRKTSFFLNKMYNFKRR